MSLANITTINGKNYVVKNYQGLAVLTLKDIDHFHDYMDGSSSRLFEISQMALVENEDFFVVSKKDLGTDFVTYFKLDSKDTTGVLLTLTGYLMLCKSMTDKRSFDISKELLKVYFKANTPQMSEEHIRPFIESINVVRNENHYILKMLETLNTGFDQLKVALTPKIVETTAINEINEWSDKAFAKIREISRALGVYDRDVLREICKDERFNGINFTDLKDEYVHRTRQKNPYLLKVIAATVEERKIFETVLDEMYSKALGKKETQVVCIPEFTTMSITEIIKPLIDKRGDKNPTATPTYRIVYKTMDVDWDKERESYKLKHGLATLPRKLTLVEEIPAMRDEFKKAVEKLLQ